MEPSFTSVWTAWLLSAGSSGLIVRHLCGDGGGGDTHKHNRQLRHSLTFVYVPQMNSRAHHPCTSLYPCKLLQFELQLLPWRLCQRLSSEANLSARTIAHVSFNSRV